MKYLLTYYILKTSFPMFVHFFKSQYAMEDNRSIKTTAQIPEVITKYPAHNCHIFSLAYASNHIEADTKWYHLSTYHCRGVTLTLHSLKCMKSQRSQSQAHDHPPKPTAEGEIHPSMASMLDNAYALSELAVQVL